MSDVADSPDGKLNGLVQLLESVKPACDFRPRGEGCDRRSEVIARARCCVGHLTVALFCATHWDGVVAALRTGHHLAVHCSECHHQCMDVAWSGEPITAGR